MSSTWSKRLKSLIGLTLIREGMVATLAPRRYFLLWLSGPRFLRQLDAWFAAHPKSTRLICIAEIGLGLALALRQNPNE